MAVQLKVALAKERDPPLDLDDQFISKPLFNNLEESEA